MNPDALDSGRVRPSIAVHEVLSQQRSAQVSANMTKPVRMEKTGLNR